MLWSLVLPFKITFYSMLGIIAFATAIAPIVRVRRTIAFACVLVVCVLLFIPACSIVMKKIDATRFGEFKYSTTAEISDSHAACYMPTGATEIRTLQEPMGIWATFKIEESDLVSYMEGRWQAWGDSAVNRDEDWKSESDDQKGKLAVSFHDVKWELLEPDVSYRGPSTADGAGFEIWYNRESKTAMLSGSYW